MANEAIFFVGVLTLYITALVVSTAHDGKRQRERHYWVTALMLGVLLVTPAFFGYMIGRG